MFNRGKFNRIKFNITLSFSPLVTITSISKQKISDEVNNDSSIILFKVKEGIEEWEVRATKMPTNPARGVGSLVGNGSSEQANEEIEFIIDDEELINGDGNYTITIYVKSGGEWYG